MVQFLSPEEAAGLIPDGATILLTGSGGGLMDADRVYQAIEQRFLQTGRPRDLTVVHITGIGDGKGAGVDRFAHEGMVRRVVGGHWGWSPRMAELALANKIEAYNLPQGVLSLLTCEIAAHRLGLLTHVGLHTFVDPRLQGGKLNAAAQEDLVEIVRLAGEERLFYRAFPVDVAIVRGTTADERGNVATEWEAVDLDVLPAAQAAHNSGGVVVAQVKRVAKAGSLHPRFVKIPGHLVDAVVIVPEQWQTIEAEYNPAFSGEIRVPVQAIAPLPLGVRKFIARRAALELRPDTVVNLGFGISDGVANVAAEEGVFERVVFSVEQGAIGGVPAKGDIFGAATNPDMIVDAPSQFNFYHGGGLDLAFLGAAQIDQQGNVNVSKFGNTIAGCGGFIDISQNAKKVVFCGTFTAKGLRATGQNGQLKIEREGAVRKFVRKVEQTTFSGRYALERGQDVLYVTERAVFKLTASGLELTEVAPGVDLKRDILAHMDFRPVIQEPLALMNQRIFQPPPIGLREQKPWR